MGQVAASGKAAYFTAIFYTLAGRETKKVGVYFFL